MNWKSKYATLKSKCSKNNSKTYDNKKDLPRIRADY